MSSFAKYSPASPSMSGVITNVTAGSPLSSSGGNTPNITLTGVVPVANGGTNSSAALANGKLMESLGGAVVESPVSISGNNVTFPGTIISGNYHIEPAISSITASTASTTVDLSTSSVFIITLSPNTTLTLSNPQSGAAYVLEFIQGASAAVVAWPATVKWPSGIAPIISTANGAIDKVSLTWDGTRYLGVFAQAFS